MTRAQLGSIQRLDKGRYRVSLEGDPKPDGKRTRKSKVVRGSREEAEIELAKMKLSAGRPVNESLTVDGFYQSVYLPSLDRLRENTRHTYVSYYDRHIKDRFGNVPLESLTALMVEQKLWEIEKPGAQRHAYAVLRQIVNMAYSYEFLDNNPFLRRIRLRPKQRYEPVAFVLSDIPKVLDAIRGENIEPVVLCMLFGGLRREEACALYWSDLTYKDGVILARIDKAYLCVKEEAMEAPVKTERSNRTVVIEDPAAGRLRELSAEGPLVPNVHGERMNPAVVAKRWRAIVKREGLKNVPMKNLRTSYATMLKQLGIDNATISELLGHTNLSTAYDHYFAVNVEAHRGVAEKLGRALRG